MLCLISLSVPFKIISYFPAYCQSVVFLALILTFVGWDVLVRVTQSWVVLGMLLADYVTAAGVPHLVTV